jgi:hypothetical protein
MSNVNKWNRNCPHKELYYSRNDNFMTAEKENCLCKRCVRIGNKNHIFSLHPKLTYGMLGKKHKLESIYL